MESVTEREGDTATPERILESARRLFLERGVRSTRMSDIAEGAGVVRQTVYDWVSSRNEIVELAMAARVRELGEVVKATPVDRSLPLRGQVMQVLMTMVQLAASDPEAENLAQAMPEQRAFLFMSGPSALTDVVVDILEPLLEEAREQGVLRDGLGTRAIAEWVQLVAASVRYRVASEQAELAAKMEYFLLPALLRDEPR
ncbi:hypothetical protein ASD11_00725 [Aeromicrobium sp. Root495]|uniref:TetR/AcrR family transcriptional regulator n=1 Tax=Aeromicrobium sp. Root495 TaxID=1736550 RepID=UPI0006F38D3A|nr:TetR/AcrR family transcriptional regulator [Aeromicrobium sp. Root495]KQY58229.1 hypothetical protein ASD11_00725 [Aeromicrobium sp. Root495]